MFTVGNISLELELNSAFFRQRSAIFLDSYKVAQIQKDWNEKTFYVTTLKKFGSTTTFD